MPTYQYTCTACGHEFEQFQSFSDDALTVCPQCEGRLRKKFNAVGVVFKGSGFYRNDSRPADTEGKPAVAAKAEAGASGGSSDGSGSSTPASPGSSDSSESSGSSDSSGSSGSSGGASSGSTGNGSSGGASETSPTTGKKPSGSTSAA